MFFFSQKNTEEQNTQRATETLSQPISQNLTAIFGSYALWILYAGGVLWVRNSALMSSVKSVSSVREKTSTKYASNPIGVTSHITPLPAGEGLGEGPLSYEFETVHKKVLLNLWVLWEKNSAASLIGLISYRGCVLFLTEKHRRTEHTAFHRDIKSTDFTEPYSHL